MTKNLILILMLMFLVSLSVGIAFADDQPVTTDQDMEELLGGFEDTEESSSKGADDLGGFEDDSSADDDLGGFGDDSSGNGDLGGFDDDLDIADAGKSESLKDKLPEWLEVNGALSFRQVLNIGHGDPKPNETDWRGVSSLRAKFDLNSKIRLPKRWQIVSSGRAHYDFAYLLNGRDEYTDQTLKEYEWEIELKDLFLQGELFNNFDIKVGRQIVVWGKSDAVRVVDVLNPLDLREIGILDIEDLRMPVTMIKTDYYFGDWNLSAMAIPEVRPTTLPGFGHDYAFFDTPLPYLEKPTLSLENTEYALALSGEFSGYDLSFHYANIWDDMAHFELGALPGGGFGLKGKYSRLNMWGAAGNMVMGSWLIKGEAAYTTGLRFFNSPEESFSRLDTTIGLEYSGFPETTIGLEYLWRCHTDWKRSIGQAPDSRDKYHYQAALIVMRNFWNNTLHLKSQAAGYGATFNGGGLFRVSLDYDLADGVNILLGTIFYFSGDEKPYTGIGDADRIYMTLKYSF